MQLIPITWTQDEQGWVDLYDGGPNEALMEILGEPGTILKFSNGTIKVMGDFNRSWSMCGYCSITVTDIVAYDPTFASLIADQKASDAAWGV